MAQHTITGHVYWQQNKYMKEPKIRFDEYDMRSWGEDFRDGRVWVGEHSTVVEVPDDFDPRPQMVGAIDREIAKARAEFTARVTELQAQRSRLLAIENATSLETQ